MQCTLPEITFLESEFRPTSPTICLDPQLLYDLVDLLHLKTVVPHDSSEGRGKEQGDNVIVLVAIGQ